MMSQVTSFVLQGVDATPCEIEADLSTIGLPKTTVVGLPDAAVREAVERVRTALENGGFRYPQQRITLNLAPADVRKEGPVYDLPFAVALMLADRTIAPMGNAPDPNDFLMAGELALDGRVRSVRGVVSLAMLAKRLGKRGVIVPTCNAREAAVVDGIDVLPVSTLSDVVGMLNGQVEIKPHEPVPFESLQREAVPTVDFGDVRGQEAAKRALTIAAAGNHNLLMLGPPGTGKTMMAKALPGILPPMSRQESLEVTRIYSSIGALTEDMPMILQRPVRSPHHTASSPAIIGGGSVPRPGDVSLAHRGILFLDEMPEFSRNVLETLRQPLEDGCVTVARAHGSVCFPARFMLVAALNPTQRGSQSEDAQSQRAMDRYLSRLSGPLVDRIDIHIDVPSIPYKELTGKRRGADTATLKSTVFQIRARQLKRQGPLNNAELSSPALDEHAPMDDTARALLEQAMTELGLSARAYDKIRRVARTVADAEDEDILLGHHIAEAVQYRILDRFGDR